MTGLSIDRTIQLSENQVTNFIRFGEASGFFGLPERIGESGLDGSLWILEGVSGQKSHMTIRWSPLPPYYSSTWDYEKKTVAPPSETVRKKSVKSSDEVGLDVFGLLMILQSGESSELIY